MEYNIEYARWLENVTEADLLNELKNMFMGSGTHVQELFPDFVSLKKIIEYRDLKTWHQTSKG